MQVYEPVQQFWPVVLPHLQLPLGFQGAQNVLESHKSPVSCTKGGDEVLSPPEGENKEKIREY